MEKSFLTAQYCNINHFLFLLQHLISLPLPFTSHRAAMRRFSSEGSLLDLDFLPWKRVALKNTDYERNRDSGTYTLQAEDSKTNRRSAGLNPIIQEPRVCAVEERTKQLNRDHSISAENIRDLGKQDNNRLGVCVINEGCRAYSDGQLAPAGQSSPESADRYDLPSPSVLSPSSPFSSKSNNKHLPKPKLSAAKLHLKSLFGQVGHLSFYLLFLHPR